MRNALFGGNLELGPKSRKKDQIKHKDNKTTKDAPCNAASSLTFFFLVFFLFLTKKLNFPAKRAYVVDSPYAISKIYA